MPSIIVPARLASTRFPHKLMFEVRGKPIILWTAERIRKVAPEFPLYFAVDDDALERCLSEAGFAAVRTCAKHSSGTDRLAEANAVIGAPVVINVQGDEPLLPAAAIEQVAENLAARPAAGIATLKEAIHDAETVFNANAVKVVSDREGFALYFSRAPIPYARDHWSGGEQTLPVGQAYWRHIGIYAYRVGFLHQFVQWPGGELENSERLEQLRAMENGVRIHIAESCVAIPGGVDTDADLQAVRALVEAGNG